MLHCSRTTSYLGEGWKCTSSQCKSRFTIHARGGSSSDGAEEEELARDSEEDTAIELTSFGVSLLDVVVLVVTQCFDSADGVGKGLADGNCVGCIGQATESEEEGGQLVHVNPAARALEKHVSRQSTVERAMEVAGELNHFLFNHTQADDSNIPRAIAIAVENVDLDDVADVDGRAGLVADDERVGHTFPNGPSGICNTQNIGDIGGGGGHVGKERKVGGWAQS